MNTKHIPNPNNYRPWLGVYGNQALIALVRHKNKDALEPLSVNEWLLKMIAHWWKQEFPGVPFPGEVERYDKDFDFVQSV